MVTHCSAFGCTNSSRKESCKKEGISFHKYPLADKILTRRWLVNVRRANFQPSRHSYLCSNHFTEEDFVYQAFTNRRGLKKGAVPTRFSYDSKFGNKKKQRKSHKNKSPEKYRDDDSPVLALVGTDTESNKMQMEDPALLEIFMNEKFYPPEHLAVLTNGLKKSFRSKQEITHTRGERSTALKESLHAKILLRSLKKQLLDAEIKAANAKRDYYEAKTEMLSRIQDYVDFDSSSDSETDSPVQKIKSRLKEEELAAEIEETVLQEQLEEAQMQAADSEKEYYEAKSNIDVLSSS